MPEEGAEAAEMQGEGKGGDSGEKGDKRARRTGGQGMLDIHVIKRAKK